MCFGTYSQIIAQLKDNHQLLFFGWEDWAEEVGLFKKKKLQEKFLNYPIEFCFIPWFHGPAAVAASLQSCPTLCSPGGQQPTGLHRPWDSPGKNTGVGCHFLLQRMKGSESEVAQSLRDPHGSTGVGCHCLLCIVY